MNFCRKPIFRKGQRFIQREVDISIKRRLTQAKQGVQLKAVSIKRILFYALVPLEATANFPGSPVESDAVVRRESAYRSRRRPAIRMPTSASFLRTVSANPPVSPSGTSIHSETCGVGSHSLPVSSWSHVSFCSVEKTQRCETRPRPSLRRNLPASLRAGNPTSRARESAGESSRQSRRKPESWLRLWSEYAAYVLYSAPAYRPQ